MMECKFIVGQKVVYIGPAPGKRLAILGDVPNAEQYLLATNSVYTVAVIAADCDDILIGLRERPDFCGYSHKMFRPLNERPSEANTDISIFRPLLNTRELEKEPT